MKHAAHAFALIVLAVAMLAYLFYSGTVKKAPPSPVATSTPSGAVTTGVRGTVLVGPTCPVEQASSTTCGDRPLSAAVTLYRTGSAKPYVNAHAGPEGSFSLSVPPGTYRLSAGTGSVLPRCADQSVSVPAEGFVSVTVYCDSGIR